MTNVKNVVADGIAAALFWPAAPFLAVAARKRWSLNLARRLQDMLGVSVLRNHYYEPCFAEADLWRTSDEPRELPGIDLNEAGQLAMLARFTFAAELARLEGTSVAGRTYSFSGTNGMFAEGDAEALYSFVRACKPRLIIEIGSGQSTLVARIGIAANQRDDSAYSCRQVCFEPFENPWLEAIGADIRRDRIERSDLSVFDSLEANDIVFIDSSHVLRAQGDVETEFLRILPRLPRGVLVHVHDIFTPRDYPIKFLRRDRRFWTEQYVLEAFLSMNSSYEVLLALHDRHVRGCPETKRAFPMLAERPDKNPGSFWMRRL